MKKLSFLTMLCLAPFSVLAAQQLSQQEAEKIQPFKEVSVRGLYYNILEYQRAISNVADRAGADYYYIKDVRLFPANERMRVITAELYKKDAPKVAHQAPIAETDYQDYNGIYEYNEVFAQTHQPKNVIYVKGYFPTPISLKQEIIKKVKMEGAQGFYIYKVSSKGSNEEATVFLFDKDAPRIAIQIQYDEIPLDSVQSVQNKEAIYASYASQVSAASPSKTTMQQRETTQSNLSPIAASTSTGKNIQSYELKTESEIPSSPQTPSTQKAVTSAPQMAIIEPKRYTVTLSDGDKIQELNDATALKMTPFKTIKFRGYFATPTEISRAAAKKASENNAKFYHIAEIRQDTGNGRNRTIYVDLYN